MMPANAAYATAVYEHALAEHAAVSRWFCKEHPEASYVESQSVEVN